MTSENRCVKVFQGMMGKYTWCHVWRLWCSGDSCSFICYNLYLIFKDNAMPNLSDLTLLEKWSAHSQVTMKYEAAHPEPPCCYHSHHCHPISFLPYHWPSFYNASSWRKTFPVLSAWMMNAPPVLFTQHKHRRGRSVETAIVFLSSSWNWQWTLQLFTLWIMSFSVSVRAYPGRRSLSEGWVMAESMKGGRISKEHLCRCFCTCKPSNTTVQSPDETVIKGFSVKSVTDSLRSRTHLNMCCTNKSNTH